MSRKKKKWDKRRQELHELIRDQIIDSKSNGVLANRSKPSSNTVYRGQKRHNGSVVDQKQPRRFKAKAPPPRSRKTRGLDQSALNEIERLYRERLERRRLREQQG